MNIHIGDRTAITKIFDEKEVLGYSELTGDRNPIHEDAEAAAKVGFSGRPVHGMLLGGLISSILGTVFPGEGTIYLEQDLKFLRPVYIGDECKAVVEVTDEINHEKGIYRLSTVITGPDGSVAVDGYAVIKYR